MSMQTNELDPAIQDRFLVYIQEMTQNLLQTILTSVVKDTRDKYPAGPEGALPHETVPQLIALWKKMNDAVKVAKLTKNFSTRKLVTAIENSRNSPIILAQNLQDLLFAVVRLDNEGHPVTAEKELVLELIKSNIEDKVKGKAGSTSEVIAKSMISGPRVSCTIPRVELAMVVMALCRDYPSYLMPFTDNTKVYSDVAVQRAIPVDSPESAQKLYDLLVAKYPQHAAHLAVVAD